MTHRAKPRSNEGLTTKPTEPLDYMDGLRRRCELELHFTPNRKAQARAMLQRGDRVSDVAEYMSVKATTINALKSSRPSREELHCRVRLPTAPKYLSPGSVERIRKAVHSAQRELDKVKQLLKEAEETWIAGCTIASRNLQSNWFTSVSFWSRKLFAEAGCPRPCCPDLIEVTTVVSNRTICPFREF